MLSYNIILYDAHQNICLMSTRYHRVSQCIATISHRKFELANSMYSWLSLKNCCIRILYVSEPKRLSTITDNCQNDGGFRVYTEFVNYLPFWLV